MNEFVVWFEFCVDVEADGFEDAEAKAREKVRKGEIEITEDNLFISKGKAIPGRGETDGIL